MDPTSLFTGLPGYDRISGYVVWAIALSALGCMFLPAPTDAAPAWWKTLYRLMNTLGGNRLNAKNHDDVVASLPAAMAQPAASPLDALDPLRKTGALMLPLCLLLPLAACTPPVAGQPQPLASPAGQLFCAFQMAGAGTMVAAIVKTEIAAGTVAAPAAAPVAPFAVLATDMGKAYVDRMCAAAALSVPGATSGVPVVPPVNPDAAPRIAVKP